MTFYTDVSWAALRLGADNCLRILGGAVKLL